jgi:phytoene/squalene synthetase
MNNTHSDLAPTITKAASKQTYYTIRLLADRDRVADAYRAYAYFRWVDDILDAELDSSLSGGVRCNRSNHADKTVERSAFIQRQKSLLERCYRGETIHDAHTQEQMLIQLVQRDTEKHSGLETYLSNMMAVMSFDAKRRGRVISQNELNEYTRGLAVAVTEALHYFIGHSCYSPHTEARYMAVSAAHLTHMLRDTYADVQAGYFNMPCEVLAANHITPQDVGNHAYRTWVRSRVQLARSYFQYGKEYLRQVGNLRCRLAGFAYIARFEWLLDTIEREGYLLRPHYEERQSVKTGLRMSLDTLSAILHPNRVFKVPETVSVRTRSLR